MQTTSDVSTTQQQWRVLSLYPNCGGLDLAFQESDRFTIVRAIEADDSSAQTYEANLRDVFVERCNPILSRYALHEADIVIGTPPCPETTTRSNFLTILNASLAKMAEENRIQNLTNNRVDSTSALKKMRRRKPLNKRKRASPESIVLLQNAKIKKSPDSAVDLADVVSSMELSIHRDSDNDLRKVGCVVARWPISVDLLPFGRPQWWCSYAYSNQDGSKLTISPPRLVEKPQKKHTQDADTSTADGSDHSLPSNSDLVVSYDADTEVDQEEQEIAIVSELCREQQGTPNKDVGELEMEEETNEKPTFDDNDCAQQQTEPESSDESETHEKPSEASPLRARKRPRKPAMLKRQISHDPDQLKEPVYDDDAIFHFLNAVAIVRPITFIMILPPKVVENESFAPLYDAIVQQASVYNYRVESVVLDAREFGVAQIRRRAVLFGQNRQFDSSHADESADVFFRKETKLHTETAVGTVLRTLPQPGVPPNIGVCNARVVPVSNPERGLRGSAYAGQIFNGGGRPIDLRQPCNTFSRYIGGNFTPIVDQAHIEDASVEPWYEQYYRALKEKGAVSVGSNGEVPTRVRRLTVTEAKILTGFDVSFRLCGSHSAQFRQIGAACSPPVAKSIVKYLEKSLQQCLQ